MGIQEGRLKHSTVIVDCPATCVNSCNFVKTVPAFVQHLRTQSVALSTQTTLNRCFKTVQTGSLAAEKKEMLPKTVCIISISS